MQIEKGVKSWLNLNDHTSTATSIAPVRSTAGNHGLTAETHRARATLARLNCDFDFINKFHF
jgi:hypothetical protein